MPDALKATDSASPQSPVLSEAVDSGLINDIEAQTVREAMELTAEAIAVDTFGEPLETRSLDTMEASVG